MLRTVAWQYQLKLLGTPASRCSLCLMNAFLCRVMKGCRRRLTHTGNRVVSTSAILSSWDLGAAGAGKLGSIGAAEDAATGRQAPVFLRHVFGALRHSEADRSKQPRPACRITHLEGGLIADRRNEPKDLLTPLQCNAALLELQAARDDLTGKAGLALVVTAHGSIGACARPEPIRCIADMIAVGTRRRSSVWRGPLR